MKPKHIKSPLPGLMAAYEMRRDLTLIFLITVLLAGAPCKAAGEYKKLSGIIIPGFASTQLRAWSILDCPYTPLDYNPLDLVWLDTTKVLNFYYFHYSPLFSF